MTFLSATCAAATDIDSAVYTNSSTPMRSAPPAAPTAQAHLSSLMYSAPHAHDTRYTHSFCAMTTQCELTFYGIDTAQGDAIAATVEARVMFLATRYNFHSADSWLTQSVNDRRQNRVAIDADFAQVLTTVREHAKLCGGVFDITVGTLAQRIKLAKSTREIARIKKQLTLYWFSSVVCWLRHERPLS